VVANRPELHVRVSPWVKRRRREGVVVHWGREEFEDADCRIMTLVSRDVFVTPEKTLDRQECLFRRRGIPVGRRSQEWRPYFRGREGG